MTRSHLALVVDDDDDVRDLIVHSLEAAGLDVISAASGAEGVQVARERDPDLITLDLVMPDLDGTDVCRQVRDFSDAYIIMITSRSSQIDRLLGLDVGADDYMAKPVSPHELRARAAALLRRPRLSTHAGAGAGEDARVSEAADAAEVVPVAPVAAVDLGGGIVLDRVRHVVSVGAETVLMTPAEADLLAALGSRPGRAWRRGELVREVWQGDFIESDFLVDVHVASVRRKLREATGGREWIRTVGGAAYVFDPSRD